MSLAPLSIQPVVDRLRAQTTMFRTIGMTADVALAQAQNVADPAAFVMLATERASERIGGSGVYRQRREAIVGVLLGIRAYGDDITDTARSDLESAISATRSALVGFRVSGADTNLEHVDGQILRIDDSAVIWWLERYRCQLWATVPTA